MTPARVVFRRTVPTCSLSGSKNSRTSGTHLRSPSAMSSSSSSIWAVKSRPT
jgi:hypothetical protein